MAAVVVGSQQLQCLQGSFTSAGNSLIVCRRPRRQQQHRGACATGPARVRCGPNIQDVPHLREYIDGLKMRPNPLVQFSPNFAAVGNFYIHPQDYISSSVVFNAENAAGTSYFRRAGPREEVAFEPDDIRAAICTCGGLCPGLNTVVRELVYALWGQYGAREIYGVQGGYRGFYAENMIELDPRKVTDIHRAGGTILGTSRGGSNIDRIVDSIQDRGINQLYVIGGDGTQRGCLAIYEECRRRKLKVAVAGIPKTIDNDMCVIDKSFGFDTAVEEAQRAINAAHVEAVSTPNGVGLVKLMGRHSGFIAMYATLGSRDVDACLIPEVPFFLEGQGGLYGWLEGRLKANGHAVIVVAEGGGQDLVASYGAVERDASGNAKLQNIGLWLQEQLNKHFSASRRPFSLKYIDPTYMIRAIPSNAADNVYCTLLAHSAVHGAMHGYTGFVTGRVNGRHAYIPIPVVVQRTNQVDIHDRMWARLMSSTGQPDFAKQDVRLADVPAHSYRAPSPVKELAKASSRDRNGSSNGFPANSNPVNRPAHAPSLKGADANSIAIKQAAPNAPEP
eukprot:jgi/Chlat1/214/Chrsp1S08777